MAIFDFWRKPVQPDQVVIAIAESSGKRMGLVTNRPFINTDLLDANGLRVNMWCQVDGVLGIITGARIDGLLEVTLQKQDGTTLMELNEQDQAVPAVRVFEPAAVARATIEQIPASRHPDVDHETHLRSFGYRSASETI